MGGMLFFIFLLVYFRFINRRGFLVKFWVINFIVLIVGLLVVIYWVFFGRFGFSSSCLSCFRRRCL